MDRVVIVPTMQNPWKKEKVLDINKRINIIYLSILCGGIIHKKHYRYTCGNSPLKAWVELSPIEKELIPPYYSYATLHALKNKYCNDEVFVLCGEDTIKDIPDWMNGGAIIQDYNFLICDRSSDSISSTEIRNKIKKKEDISKYVNVNVIDLIKKYYE
jgi:nicotinic acid mononucleotide adenylyltransferase